MSQVYDIVIIGGGPAGYTAAMYGARAGFQVLVLEQLAAGGQMNLTHQIDNYPGFPQGVDGFTLGQSMLEGAKRFGAETRYAQVTAVELRSSPKRIEATDGTVLARAVILATGANPRKLELPGEEALTGKGVSYCAFCDGMFYRGKTVVVAGGGNSAAAEALQLSRVAKQVYMVHRRDALRATRIYHKHLEEAGNITFLGSQKVAQLLYDQRLSGVVLENTLTGETQTLEAEGLFVSIGREPATGLVADQLTLDEQGYIPADETTRTEIPGVFAIGDVRSKALRQVVTATADGAAAIHFAEEYLTEH